MPRTMKCSCGSEFRSRDEEELYSLFRQHVDPLHPEMHFLVERRAKSAEAASWRPRTRRIYRPSVLSS